MTDEQYEAEVRRLRDVYKVSKEEAAPFELLAYMDKHSSGYQDVLFALDDMLEAYVKALKARG